MKVRWPNLGRWLLVMAGLLIGAAAGWWFTLKDWQREELIFRLRWKLGELIGSVAPEPRAYRYFANCEAARRAGYENMTADEPSYRPELDEDSDGVACEPWPRKSRRRFRF